ncbi:hypothetical protein [Neosynechococcus sphagnicola]|uniref:hypothetical protein n=1 Tax=Neosynechococcus sphagnicola TaxID=1501145 RepID=UPI000907A388|nr:hypothetical protein [Neosynechococcus sphagnicola]
MKDDTQTESPELQAIAATIRTLADQRQGDSLALLAILRVLESLHREIRDGYFQTSLPDNRQGLYALLRDIEAKGGWPYIYSRTLRSLLIQLTLATTSASTPAAVSLEPPTNTEIVGNPPTEIAIHPAPDSVP